MIRKTGISNRRPNLTKSIVICCILFSLLALTNSSLVLGQSEEWLSIEDEFFVIKYKEGYRSDAELILEYSRYARNVTMEAYPHKLEVKVKVYLYDYGSWKDPPWVTRADPPKAEMYFLTPSDVPEQYRKYIDNLWYQKNVVHEYVHIPTLRDIGGSAKNPPSWFKEGIAEYIAVFHTTKEILQKCNWELKNVEDIVKKGDGYLLIVSGDVYGGGAYILKYMYDTYGKDRVVAVLKSETKSFMEALERELEVTYYEFEDNWLKWACEEFDADPTLYVSFESYEDKQLYEELLSSYNELNTTYHKLTEDYASLNSSYYDLLADFDALNMNYISLNSSYSNLVSDYNNLQSEKLTLETQVSTLQANVSSLQSEVDKLKLDYDSLEGDCESLKTVYDKLETDYNSLRASYDELESRYQMNINELSTARNLMYVFMVTTIAFISMTAYFAKRKPSVVSECGRLVRYTFGEV